MNKNILNGLRKIKTQFTHTGWIRKCSAACLGNDYQTKLRATSSWWVTEDGRKFNKTRGWAVGVKWPHWMLDLSSVTPIQEDGKNA